MVPWFVNLNLKACFGTGVCVGGIPDSHPSPFPLRDSGGLHSSKNMRVLVLAVRQRAGKGGPLTWVKWIWQLVFPREDADPQTQPL